MRKPIAESKMNTVLVPAVGTAPATLYVAASAPLRIVVRNISGAVILLSHNSTTLNQPPVLADTFQLGPGTESVFILVPKQGIYAGAAGAGGIVSIAVSEAIPISWMES